MEKAPYFEDISVGDEFNDVPAVTLTDGHTAIHQALFGDRSRLPLDLDLSHKVTGHSRALVSPSLVCNLAIGQSTLPSQRVMGNLFYRGLHFHRPVYVGDTLRTATRVVALRQNKVKEGRAASGMVALEIHVTNQTGETVLLFWRCPMIPCEDPTADTGKNDSFDGMPETISDMDLVSHIPEWDYGYFRDALTGKHFADYQPGDVFAVESRDTVTLAPELVRMTLNMAMAHTDASRSVYGKRLVYGGHTISMAAAHISHALPNLITVLAWFRCDHVAPVFELDILNSVVHVEDLLPADSFGLAKIHVEVFATRGPEAPESGDNIKVLDWHLAALLA
ncbi:MAG: acyl dehydratase [Gammaproteobacteria bacterium]|jgi:acyl dehydratase|nr:acyl dehydratase [Gammaproteobacteria bacterium]|tara:strand:+ start:247 stop:1254 length:1008 start_codon:yes stop_codon:yes gene_type:complete